MPWFALRDYSNNRNLAWKLLVKHKNDSALGIEKIANPEKVETVHRFSGVHYRANQLTPGYVYVKIVNIMPLKDLIESLPHLTKQVPVRDIISLTGNDERRLLEMIEKHRQQEPSEGISVGDLVCITAGAFEHYQGSVETVGKQKATVICSVFDRSTPLEVDLRHLVKIAD